MSNRDSALSVTQVAAAFGVTPRWVHRLFEPTGRSFGETLLEMRLDRAADALREDGDSRSVSSIAYGCGFNDLSHFNRRFRARFGMTPRALRAEGG